MSLLDISVSFPSKGVIRLRSRWLFGDAENPICRQFARKRSTAKEISNVSISGGNAPPGRSLFSPSKILCPWGGPTGSCPLGPGHGRRERGQGPTAIRRDLSAHGRANTPSRHAASDSAPRAWPRANRWARRCEGHVGFFTGDRRRRPLYDSLLSPGPASFRLGNQVRLAGPASLKNPALFRKKPPLPGDRARADRSAGNRPVFDKLDLIHRAGALRPPPADEGPVDRDPRCGTGRRDRPDTLDQPDLQLPLCTASLPLAATAQFVAAPLLPAAAALYAYTSIPTFKEARRIFVDEKRIGVDALDAVVMVGCLGTMSIFPGAVCCWCLSFGRYLVKQSRDSSQKLLLNAFGKQPRYVWLCRDDGSEIQVLADKLEKGTSSSSTPARSCRWTGTS